MVGSDPGLSAEQLLLLLPGLIVRRLRLLSVCVFFLFGLGLMNLVLVAEEGFQQDNVGGKDAAAKQNAVEELPKLLLLQC